MAEEIRLREVGVVVVDAALSPVQQRNLERAWDCKVIDRTGLILEIFGERARTREGKLQVELAALTYQRSRLVRSWRSEEYTSELQSLMRIAYDVFCLQTK